MTEMEENKLRHATKSGRIPKIIFMILIFLVVVAFITVSLWQDGTFRNISQSFRFKNSYQAVFLNNGQLYFGKITEITNEYIIMEKPHFLQLAQESEDLEVQEVQPEMKLISIKDEFHKPKDFVLIEKSAVIFIEELRDVSQIADAIANF